MEDAVRYCPNAPTLIIVGNFGSGKTEVAVNLAMCLAGTDTVRIVDLDIVNPYFRCREAREEMESRGIKVIYPRGEYHSADLPIILPEIRGALAEPEGVTILDVGGDDVGARALSSLADAVAARPYSMLQVVNARRPFTGDVEGCLKIKREIEDACRLRMTGLIGNTHLMQETDAEVIRDGLELTRQVAAAAGIPLEFVTVDRRFASELAGEEVPLLAIERRMLKPWELAKKADHADWIRKHG